MERSSTRTLPKFSATTHAGVSVTLALTVTLISTGMIVPGWVPFSGWVSFFSRVAILFPVGLAFDTIKFEGKAESFGEKVRRFRLTFFRALIFACLATVLIPLVSHFVWQFPPEGGRFVVGFFAYSILLYTAIDRLFN